MEESRPFRIPASTGTGALQVVSEARWFWSRYKPPRRKLEPILLLIVILHTTVSDNMGVQQG